MGFVASLFFEEWNTKTTFMKVFRIRPKRIKRTNGTVLTPDMEVTVTTRMHTNDPFYNGGQEVAEMYMRIYGFDYKKACCHKVDFEFEALG